MQNRFVLFRESTANQTNNQSQNVNRLQKSAKPATDDKVKSVPDCTFNTFTFRSLKLL